MSVSVTQFRRRFGRLRRVCGFTLIELTSSLAITSIIMVAMGSAMVIAARSLPNPDNRAGQIVEAVKVVDEISSQLSYAFAIDSSTPTSISFTVLRNGVMLNISYEWSGVSGDPLICSYDGGTDVIMAENVRGFSLSLKSESVEVVIPMLESDEIELGSHVDLSSPQVYLIDSTNWIGQYIVPPSLPAEAVSWKVTRVQIEARARGGTKGETFVQLRTPKASNLPDSLVLEQVTMFEADLQSTLSWQEIPFSFVSGLDPSVGLCLVLEWASDKDSAEVSYGNNSGSNRLISSDAGASWNKDLNMAMNYYVYGTYLYSDPAPQPVGGIVLAVNIELNLTEDSDTRVFTKTLLFNTPEIGGAP